MTREFYQTRKVFSYHLLLQTTDTSKHLPNDSNTNFNGSLIEAQKEQKEIILLQDFNAKYLKRDNCKEIKTIIETNGFYQLVKKPNCITQITKVLIYMIATNKASAISQVIVQPLSLGDHKLIGFI